MSRIAQGGETDSASPARCGEASIRDGRPAESASTELRFDGGVVFVGAVADCAGPRIAGRVAGARSAGVVAAFAAGLRDDVGGLDVSAAALAGVLRAAVFAGADFFAPAVVDVFGATRRRGGSVGGGSWLMSEVYAIDACGLPARTSG
ncbi:hypothetical protein [Dokdonella sp.]|uniref:hypothetical protein n=1 Tax=Dokdonella sp. TaxID=2291710 RepID=UPI0035294DE9